MFTKTFCILCSAASIAACLGTNTASGVVVIHEVFAAGGSANPSVLYKKDYIELFNTAWTTVDLTGWALDYAPRSDSFSTNRFEFPTGTKIPAESNFLLAVGNAGEAGDDLEADLVTTSLSLNLQAGKLRVVNTALVAADDQTVIGPGVDDFLGYGSQASLFEGSGPAPFPTNNEVYWLTANRDDHWDTNDNATDFYLALPTLNRASQLPPPSGDFNGDGTVNLADYTVWRDTLGATLVPGTGADGDYSGTVDSGDYDAWRSNFGSPGLGAVAGVSTVPEPGTVLGLLSLLAVGCVLSRRATPT